MCIRYRLTVAYSGYMPILSTLAAFSSFKMTIDCLVPFSTTVALTVRTIIQLVGLAVKRRL